MLKPAEFFTSYIQTGAKASDNTITLAKGHAQALDAVGKGNYTYLTIRDSAGVEVVKYTHIEDYANRSRADTIQVERNAARTGGRRNFPPGACVKHEWFARSINEIVSQGNDEEIGAARNYG